MVSFPEYTGMSITPATATIADDTYIQFTAYAHYDDGSSYPLNWIETSWNSSDTTIATFSNNTAFWGRAFGAAPGTVTVTAYTVGHGVEDPLYHATATLTVTTPPPPPPPPEARFSLGFGAGTLDPYPTWTAIDTHPNLVASYSIDRGRSYELDQTDAGRASVTITDPDGLLDPTNPSGPYYGQIRPLLHAVICRHDPITDTWEERFRGYVEEYTYDIHPSQQVNQLTVTLVDLFEVASSAEMQPGQFGANFNGQIGYDVALSNERITEILFDLGLPRPRYAMLPGTVTLHSSRYSGGETALSAIQEAADGEFPNVANVYCDRHGRLCFHGRTARFDPAGTAAAAGGDWDYHHWKAGDGAAITASPTDTAQVRALGFTRGLSKIINIATALELGAPDDAAITRQVTDAASIAAYGMRSWSVSNLLTFLGDEGATYRTSAATETKRFASFYVQNYAQPKDRITGVEFRSLHPDDPRAPANWQLLTQVDVGDTITVSVATAGGGGFHAEEYFVEGVHEDVKPLAPGYDDVTLTLDLSPRTYYSADPWVTPLSAPDPSMPAPGTDQANPSTNPPAKSGKPKPPAHARDHEHDGPDPHRIHYEKVGTEAGGGDGGGSEPDPLAIRYETDNEGTWLDIGTTGAVPGTEPGGPLEAGFGTRFHADTAVGSNHAVGIHATAAGIVGRATALTLKAEAPDNTSDFSAARGLEVQAEGGTGALGISVVTNGGYGIQVLGAGTGINVGVDNGTGISVHVGGSSGAGLFVSFAYGGGNTIVMDGTGIYIGGARVLTE